MQVVMGDVEVGVAVVVLSVVVEFVAINVFIVLHVVVLVFLDVDVAGVNQW